MRVFVSEYVCSGAWPEDDLPESLAREGRAMLLALLADLAALPDVTLCTTWDARLSDFPLGNRRLKEPRGLSPWPRSAEENVSPVDCNVIYSPAGEPAAFRRLAAHSDATYNIAPELDDLLTSRCDLARRLNAHCLNTSHASLSLYSDKWETFRHLSRAGAPTIPTALLDSDDADPDFDFPVVIKPRFGAGSTDTFLIHNADQLRSVAARFFSEGSRTGAIVQPYVVGHALSVAAIFRSDGALREVWPVGEQQLSGDGRFTYLGGAIPATSSSAAAISELIFQISGSLSDLSGYVGLDVLVPNDGHPVPLIVDINPRLTTSYLGYRAFSRINLAGRILWPDRDWPPLDWHGHAVKFRADGHVSFRPLHS